MYYNYYYIHVLFFKGTPFQFSYQRVQPFYEVNPLLTDQLLKNQNQIQCRKCNISNKYV